MILISYPGSPFVFCKICRLWQCAGVELMQEAVVDMRRHTVGLGRAGRLDWVQDELVVAHLLVVDRDTHHAHEAPENMSVKWHLTYHLWTYIRNRNSGIGLCH